jgi:hypothetical protein
VPQTAALPLSGTAANEDSFIPLGDAALDVLLSEEAIEKAALELVGR